MQKNTKIVNPKNILALLGITSSVASFTFITIEYGFDYKADQHPLAVFITLIALIVGFFSLTYIMNIIIGYFAKAVFSIENHDLVSIIQERREINERIREKPKEDIIDTIRLGLNHLTEYYIINKSQAKSSFGFSLFAIVLGLFTIFFGIGLFYLQKYQNIQLTAITSISGVLLEFIGGAYFFVYRKSIEQMNLYFNQLVKMQDTMLAVKLTQDIPNQEKQINLTEKIVLELLECVILPSRWGTVVRAWSACDSWPRA